MIDKRKNYAIQALSHYNPEDGYNPIQIANEFISIAKNEGLGITPLKLIKLVYIAHGICLASTNKQLVNEYIQAWKYGPVIPSIYHEFKIYGENPITDFGGKVVLKMIKNTSIKEEYLKVMISTWKKYKNTSGLELSRLTHQEGTPWSEVYRDNLPLGYPIDNEKIKTHFKNLMIKS